jgi:hypothetical protein
MLFLVRMGLMAQNIICILWSSCLHRASMVSRALFIIPTDAHDYKIIGTLKTIKIPTVAPTCFGSRRNHHQGAILCLAKLQL